MRERGRKSRHQAKRRVIKGHGQVKVKVGRAWPRVVLLGDSITQFGFSKDGCWIALLADHLQRRCDVINRGFSGYNTRWCKLILPTVIEAALASDTVAMTICLGANDSFSRDPKLYVPLEEYTQNLRDIIKYCLASGMSKERVILISPPTYDNELWLEFRGKHSIKDNATTQSYAQACCGVGREMGVVVIDLFSHMTAKGDFKGYLSDGVHLSESGSQLLFELLEPIVDKLTADLPSTIFPDWEEVDNSCPERFFPPPADNHTHD